VDGEKEAVDALKAGKINCVVQCTPDLGKDLMELVRGLTEGREIPRITHPQEGVFCDFDDLTDPSVEGF
jgi:simple sugar transport system substrate-binding protein